MRTKREKISTLDLARRRGRRGRRIFSQGRRLSYASPNAGELAKVSVYRLLRITSKQLCNLLARHYHCAGYIILATRSRFHSLAVAYIDVAFHGRCVPLDS
jgi:hypothetical protein